MASKRGAFFTKVMQAAARRLDPTESSELEPADLKARGLSMAKYMERFGGYGQVKNLALIQWQVCLALDQALAGNQPACLDILAPVCVPGTGVSGQWLHGRGVLADPPAGAVDGDGWPSPRLRPTGGPKVDHLAGLLARTGCDKPAQGRCFGGAVGFFQDRDGGGRRMEAKEAQGKGQVDKEGRPSPCLFPSQLPCLVHCLHVMPQAPVFATCLFLA